LNVQVGTSPRISRPCASLATARSFTTSPVRARVDTGWTSTLATGVAATSTVQRSDTAPADATIEALPGATASRSPSLDTRTTAGRSLVHCTRSLRRSSAFEYTVAPRRTRWPMASRAGFGDTATRAAGPGTIETSNRSTTGFTPGTIAIAVIGIVPTEPAVSFPVESTTPSKKPPAFRNTMRAFGTGFPASSSSCALKRRVSPATTVRVVGVTTRRCVPWPAAVPASVTSSATAPPNLIIVIVPPLPRDRYSLPVRPRSRR
jgi:hypothetical protein